MNSECVRAWLKIQGCSGIGDVTLRHLMESFDSPQAVVEASRSDLLAVQGLRQEIVDQIPQCVDDRLLTKSLIERLTLVALW